MRYFEDLVVGQADSFGHRLVERQEVIDFAGRYDPQPFHLDDAAAAATHFGRLSASGWHTCAMTMSMIVENFRDTAVASLGAAGIDALRWLKPVYPGDVLRCETVIEELRASRSRPEMGSVRTRLTVFNQDDVAVLSLVSIGLIATRGGIDVIPANAGIARD